ncbi:hypothetical protein [Bradyrhizobium sp. 62]|uniref:hypothetical protein n=1 Tax=Bradyrhizobium sp. 62 TaxID=1043588 RepID=UPI001FF96205|nr:hypothetical protein [Bradyrhizobium sp. 62]
MVAAHRPSIADCTRRSHELHDDPEAHSPPVRIGSGEHLDSISHAFLQGRLKEPAQPMSDQELARAIREFQAVPVSDWALAKLSQRLLDPAMPRDE